MPPPAPLAPTALRRVARSLGFPSVVAHEMDRAPRSPAVTELPSHLGGGELRLFQRRQLFVLLGSDGGASGGAAARALAQSRAVRRSELAAVIELLAEVITTTLGHVSARRRRRPPSPLRRRRR